MPSTDGDNEVILYDGLNVNMIDPEVEGYLQWYGVLYGLPERFGKRVGMRGMFQRDPSTFA